MAYELLETEQNDQNPALNIAKESGREVARQGSNLATRAVGLPGDIFSLVNEFIARPVQEKISGGSVPYEETPLGKVLPTTETHRKNIASKTGEFLKPQNKIEQFADDLIEDTALLFTPGGLVKQGKKALKLGKDFAKALGANLAGETVKQTTSSEDAGNYTKAGSLFLLSLIDQESAAKQLGKLYEQSYKNLPENATTSAKTLSKKLIALEHKITKGRPLENLSPPEKYVTTQSEKIKNLIKNDKINIHQATAQKRSLNTELRTLYKEVPGKHDQKSVKNLAKQLNSFLNETIEEYGKTNSKFYKPYKEADQGYGALAKSNLVSQWVENNVIQHPATTGLLHLFAPIGVPIAGATSTAILPYQIGKLIYRVRKSPALFKIYQNAVKSAAKEDSITFNKYLNELDKAIQKEESQDQYEFVD